MLPFVWCGPYDRCQRCHRPKRLAMTNPSVFLSYSHDSAAHKAWVRKLAEDLRGQGVDAILDQWDLRHGADLLAFMEAGIREAERLLILLYAERLEDLVRELHDLPRFRKPPLGRPAFLPDTVESVVIEPQLVQPAAAIPLQRITINTNTCLLRQEGGRWRGERRPLQVEGYWQQLAEAVAITLVQIPAGNFCLSPGVFPAARSQPNLPSLMCISI